MRRRETPWTDRDIGPTSTGSDTNKKTTNGRVLLVDNKKINRILLSMELEAASFEVTTASSGERGIEKALEVHPEVILLDVHMSPMSGIETCKRLKANPVTEHIPILFITGDNNEELIVEALSAGGSDIVPKPFSPPILIARLKSHIRLYRSYLQLQALVVFDELTHTYTRRYLMKVLNRSLKMLGRGSYRVLSCLLIDIDHFKSINDRFGHMAGDKMLERIAHTILTSTRETDIVARLGGEEFVMVLPDTDRDQAALVAEKLRQLVEAHCRPATISVGVTSLHSNLAANLIATYGIEETVTELIDRADKAMYAAKEEGRNQVFSQGSESHQSARVPSRRKPASAENRGEFGELSPPPSKNLVKITDYRTARLPKLSQIN